MIIGNKIFGMNASHMVQPKASLNSHVKNSGLSDRFVRFSAETDEAKLQEQALIKAVATYLDLPQDAPFHQIQMNFLERATSAMLDNSFDDRVHFLVELQNKLEEILLERNQLRYAKKGDKYMITTELAHLVYKALKIDDMDPSMLP